MALKGTIYGSFTAMATSKARPYISWSATQNIANNTTTVTATLIFVRYDGYRSWVNDARSFTVTIDGTNYTLSSGYDMGPNGKTSTIGTASKTITHDSDGKKKITIKASGNTGLSNIGSVSLSQEVTLDTIPRASGFTAFSLSSTSMAQSTARTINYTLDRKSTSFSQDMTLKLGSKVIKSWNTGSTGALTASLTAAEVNTIISSLPNSTSGTLTLTMQTKSGSSNIGSPVSRSVSISINSSVAPSASGMSVSIYGSGRDKTINKYVQGVTKVTASFTRSAGYGASISSSSIVVRRVSGGSNSQSISGNSGTTANPVTLSGQYEAIGTVKDSRGRTATSRVTFTVEAYASPKINSFTARRNQSVTSTVNVGINLVYSPMGTTNPATILLVGVDKSGTKVTHRNNTGQTAGSLVTTQNIANQSDAGSFVYTLTVTDSFGKKAEAEIAVGTAFIELSIARGKGIGVGKIHERGSMDLAGEAYISGQLYLSPPKNQSYAYPRLQLHSNDLNGHSYMEWFGSDALRKAYIGISSSGVDYFSIGYDGHPDGAGRFYLGPQNFNLRYGTATYNGKPVFSSDNEEIWSGAIYVQSGQTVPPTKKLSECPNGWILVWGRYTSGATAESDFGITVIPKAFARLHSGRGLWATLQGSTNQSDRVTKYLYVHDDKIEGHDNNRTAPNNMLVLRRVFAF